MQLSNRHGLPQTFVNLAKRDRYTKGKARLSVTELIGSPRIRIMRQRHADLIVEDVADRLWALIGTALHSVLERGADEDHLAEERLFATVNGIRISGGIDLQITERDADKAPRGYALSDNKLTSAWSVMNPKKDWERQLNCYAWLVEEVKKTTVTGLTVNAIIRDWSRKEAQRNPSYPQAPLVVVPQRLWSPEERRDYIHSRVAIHLDADRASEWEERLPDCTDEERWYRPGKIAVVKDGRQRALKLFEAHEKEEAEVYAVENGARIEARPGENVRCESFCPVAEWCEQWALIKATGA